MGKGFEQRFPKMDGGYTYKNSKYFIINAHY